MLRYKRAIVFYFMVNKIYKNVELDQGDHAVRDIYNDNCYNASFCGFLFGFEVIFMVKIKSS